MREAGAIISEDTVEDTNVSSSSGLIVDEHDDELLCAEEVLEDGVACESDGELDENDYLV